MLTQRQAREERNRDSRALAELGEEARCMAHERDPDYVWERLERRGTTRTRVEVEAIFQAYREAPHVHAIYTSHVFARPCNLGREHPGCCPGTPGCDQPGRYDAAD